MPKQCFIDIVSVDIFELFLIFKENNCIYYYSFLLSVYLSIYNLLSIFLFIYISSIMLIIYIFVSSIYYLTSMYIYI